MKILLKDPDLVEEVLIKETQDAPPADFPLSEYIHDIKKELEKGEPVILEVEYRLSGIFGGRVSEIWYYSLSDMTTDRCYLDGYSTLRYREAM